MWRNIVSELPQNTHVTTMGISCSHPEEREKSRKFHHTKIAPSKKTHRSNSNGSDMNPSISITYSKSSGFALSNRSSEEIWHGVSRSKRRVSATPSVNMITEEGDDPPGSMISEEGDNELNKSSASGGRQLTAGALQSNRRTSLEVGVGYSRRTSLEVGLESNRRISLEVAS